MGAILGGFNITLVELLQQPSASTPTIALVMAHIQYTCNNPCSESCMCTAFCLHRMLSMKFGVKPQVQFDRTQQR